MRRWRDAVMALSRRTGCPLGALVYQLPRGARRAQTVVEDGLEAWRGLIEDGLVRMQARGELARDAAPADIALAVLSAVQGGLLLSRSAKSDRPLELAFDMALAHVAAQVRRPGAARASPREGGAKHFGARGPRAGRGAVFALTLARDVGAAGEFS